MSSSSHPLLLHNNTGVATLIVNPAAGRASYLRARLPALTNLLVAHGFRPEVVFTSAEPHSGRQLARASRGSALVLACGGDGTVHDVVQGLAHTSVPLGVLPLGTANALARNLGLPLQPLAALKRLLTYRPRRIPLGAAETAQGNRYFTVMAGCGPDGALAHTLPAALKQRLGRAAYYVHAARLFGTRRWPPFRVDYQLAGEPGTRTAEAVALLAARVPNLGGLFSGLTAGASLDSPTLHVKLLRAPAHLSLPGWLTLGRLGLPHPLAATLKVTSLSCSALGSAPVWAQVDAEPVGALPLSLHVVPNALALLMPPPRE